MPRTWIFRTLNKNKPGQHTTSLLTVCFVSVFQMSQGKHKTRPQLFAHCYQEGEGGKGSDNVASLILQALHDQGFIKLDDNGNPIHSCQLTIAADNCSSQNKNNMVIQLVPWLVEKGFYEEMELLFYVHGHTKNVCDHMFNQLKAGFHNHNIYTYNHPSEHSLCFESSRGCDGG